jgi:hypothetical protein
MQQLENELRAALSRKRAPAHLAARLQARLPLGAPSRPVPRLVTRWAWALAATVLLALGGGLLEHERHVRERNRAALEQTLTALSIAATQLERAQSRAFAPALWSRVGEHVAEASADGQT